MEVAGATAGTGRAWPQFPQVHGRPASKADPFCFVYSTSESPKSIHLLPSIPGILLIEVSASVSRFHSFSDYPPISGAITTHNRSSSTKRRSISTRDHNGGIRSPHWHCQREYCLVNDMRKKEQMLISIIASKPAVCAGRVVILPLY